MSHNDTWMPLYIGDYLGDTMELDGAQHGAYLLLLMYYWRNGPLPLEDAKLAQIARTDIRAWKKAVGPVVRAFFHEQDGRLHQKRCDLELTKAAECHERAAERRQTDNHRLRIWRARQGEEEPHPPDRPNGKATNETRFTGVSEDVSKRPGNADETRLTPTGTKKQVKEERKETNLNLNSSTGMCGGAREKPPADSVGSAAVAAQIRRVANANRMSIPYGEVRSAEAQIAALQAQPAAAGADVTMGLKWQPAEQQNSVEVQAAAALAGCTEEQIAKAAAYAASGRLRSLPA